MRAVDLNADLGESFGRWRLGDDEALLDVVTSANIPCGFHAGDPTTLVATCRTAVARGVAIGAQVGYRDLAGFGRRFIDVAPEDLYADVLYQLAALDGIARTVGGGVAYVKPHGALYNAAVHHEGQARAVVDAVRDFGGGLTVLGMDASALLVAASAAGLPVAREVFADRAYADYGTLVSRREQGAVLTDVDAVTRRVRELVVDGSLTTSSGSALPVAFDSICVHGDSPGAVAMARAVRRVLDEAGVDPQPFAPA